MASKVICIMGESGSGKTTTMRTLPPEETYYIDCDMKGLSWKGWRENYSEEKKNYKQTNDAVHVERLIQNVSAKSEKTHYIVIDTINSLMVADEMRRMKEKTYDKWADLAVSVWNLLTESYKLRDDIIVIYTAHTQTERDDSGYQWTRLKTSGKKLDKIVLESRFTSVLLSKKTENGYVLETHANNSTTKTPLGAFEADVIDNDIMLVLDALKNY